ncbi:hypothetical protein CRE_17252 [Caenorhabditis remanei]|uniref:Uncharacterized protein n=1 Tax=Caenorhabditis remanei TaxID=31234 RepID=E3MAD5_CAERE|nr:hypothetical protein CRE_17252 [Caenorhabditis remanei]
MLSRAQLPRQGVPPVREMQRRMDNLYRAQQIHDLGTRYLLFGTTTSLISTGHAFIDATIISIIRCGYGSILLPILRLLSASDCTFPFAANCITLFTMLCGFVPDETYDNGLAYKQYALALRDATMPYFEFIVITPDHLNLYRQLTENCVSRDHLELLTKWFTKKPPSILKGLMYLYNDYPYGGIWNDSGRELYGVHFYRTVENCFQAFPYLFAGKVVDVLTVDATIQELSNNNIADLMIFEDKLAVYRRLVDTRYLEKASYLNLFFIMKTHHGNHLDSPDTNLLSYMENALKTVRGMEKNTIRNLCVIPHVFEEESLDRNNAGLTSSSIAAALLEDLIRTRRVCDFCLNRNYYAKVFANVNHGEYSIDTFVNKFEALLGPMEKFQNHHVNPVEIIEFAKTEMFDFFVVVTISAHNLALEDIILKFNEYRSIANAFSKLIIVGVDNLPRQRGLEHLDNVMLVSGVNENTFLVLDKILRFG